MRRQRLIPERRSISLLLLLLPCSCAAPSPPCALPPPGVDASSPAVILRDFRGVDLPLVDAITIRGDGGIAFNDTPVSLEQARSYIEAGAQFTPQPFIAVDFERGADCATINRVRRMIDLGYDCKNSNRCLQGARPEWATR